MNSALIKNGHAVMMTIPPNVKRAHSFYSYQKAAQDAKLGVWR